MLIFKVKEELHKGECRKLWRVGGVTGRVYSVKKREGRYKCERKGIRKGSGVWESVYSSQGRKGRVAVM